MTSIQPYDVDMSWMDVPETMSSLEIMLRSGISPQKCAQILSIDFTALAVALQTNPNLKKILGQTLDANRHTIARKAASKSETILEKVEDIALGNAANGSDVPSYKEMLTASKLVFEVAGVTGNRAAAAEQRQAGESENVAQNELFSALAAALAGQLQLKQ